MYNWGSIPDWLSVFITFLALVGFVIVERERLILRKQSPSKNAENIGTLTEQENDQTRLTENNIDTRAELYSRILIGIMFGVSLSPILTWISSNLFPTKDYTYEYRNNTESTIAILFAIVLSSLLTFIYSRAYPRFASVFVHWAERFAFSYLGIWIILFVFSGWTRNPETEIYYIETYSFIDVTISVIMFLLIGFSSTPIDWIIYLINKSKERKT